MNRIKELRGELGLTQRELAERSGISQQHLQRLEAASQVPRLHTAQKISAALGADLEVVFPEERRNHRSIRDFRDYSEDERGSPAGSVVAAEITRTLKVILRNGLEALLPYTEQDHDRLFNLLQSDEGHFIVFDSDAVTVILNAEHILVAQLLFDRIDTSIVTPARAHAGSTFNENGVQIYLASNPKPLGFGVDPDERHLHDDEGSYWESQLQNLVFDAEMMRSSKPSEQRYMFIDEDGEYVFGRWRDVVMMTIPLDMKQGRLGEPADEEHKDGGADGVI